MRRAARADYLPGGMRHAAGLDRPLSIGDGVTNSQPSTVRTMLELLDVRPGQRVLDVGSGSGWTTAILAHLVGPQGSVLGVELVPELAEQAAARVARADLPRARVEAAAHGILGAPDRGPFERILVSAMARETPQELVDQLAEDARMVVPVQGRMLVVERRGGRVRTHEGPGHYRFVPLR